MKTRFNEERADRAVDFFERRLRHTKGRWSGEPFLLDDWQRDDIIRPLFGWERWSPELKQWVRKYRKAYIELPKKSGKSELGAGIAGYCLYSDGEQGAEVFSIAADKKQAGLVFNVLADMVSMEPVLAGRSEVARSRIAHHGVIYVPRTRASYVVLPGDVDTVDGINPSAVILDEIHRQPGRELYDLMDESFGARTQPLFVILTTAGYEDETHIAWEVHRYAEQVAKGIIQDPYFLPVIRGCSQEEADGDKWQDEELWRKVNPVLAGFNPSGVDEMRRLANEAAESPAKVAAFKRYRLNVWLPRAAGTGDQLVTLQAWDRSAGMSDAPEGSKLYVGLDMAASDDIAALVGLVPTTACKNCRDRHDTCWNAIAKFWIPSVVLADDSATWARNMKQQLNEWARQGFVGIVDGDVIDGDTVYAAVADWADRYDVQAVAKDPWQTKDLGVRMVDAGLPVFDHGQGMGSMADPTDAFIAAVKDGRFHHGGHPVLRWMASNAVGQSDVDGRVKPSKRKSTGKIDGVVAAVMALGAGLEAERVPEPGVAWL